MGNDTFSAAAIIISFLYPSHKISLPTFFLKKVGELSCRRNRIYNIIAL